MVTHLTDAGTINEVILELLDIFIGFPILLQCLYRLALHTFNHDVVHRVIVSDRVAVRVRSSGCGGELGHWESCWLLWLSGTWVLTVYSSEGLN